MDLVGMLREQAARTSEMVGNVRPDQLGLRTPCPGYDVRGLINHLCLFSDWCARLAAGEHALPDNETDFVGDDPAGAYDRWKDAMVDACSAPGLSERIVHTPKGDYPGAVAIALGLMDTVVHRWDLARALGVDPDIPDHVAEATLAQLEAIITDEMRAPAPDETTGDLIFGPRIEVPPDASAVDRLVAFLGRKP